jgi:hypothetical protein
MRLGNQVLSKQTLKYHLRPFVTSAINRLGPLISLATMSESRLQANLSLYHE